MLPALYGLLVALGFFIGPKVGIAVIVFGACAFGLVWSQLKPPTGGRDRSARRAARAERRAAR